MSKILFHEALQIASEFTDNHYSELGNDPVLLRDIYGRVSLVLTKPRTKAIQKLAKEFCSKLAPYCYPHETAFIYTEELIAIDTIIKSPDKIRIPWTKNLIYLLDRQITGQDWLRQPIKNKNNQKIPRVTLFGIKGGVGRSTALAIWSWHLAKLGKKVLVIDLDLESPGIGQIMLPQNRVADYGIVDWLVEEAVGQSDESLIREMVATSPLAESTEGSIRVVSAAGSKEQDYIAKLSRVYLDINQGDQVLDFAHRLANLLDQLEAQEKPDIVLLDSRAGIHDIAAIAITRLTDLALLFAVNTPQTWQAYKHLFSHWQKWNVNLTKFRENLKIVAGLIPEQNSLEYLERFRESSYNLFSETIYEEEINPEDQDYFNFSNHDSSAPHFPIAILWNIKFQEFNPENERYFEVNAAHLNACYGQFLHDATQLSGVIRYD